MKMTMPIPRRGGRNVPTKRSEGPHVKTLVDAMTDPLGDGAPVLDGARVEVRTIVDPLIVDTPVEGEGVDVIVVSFPEIVVTRVVGSCVLVNVLRDPDAVDTKVSVIGAVPVGVIVMTSVVGVPPMMVVNVVGGGVVAIVTGEPLIVVTIFVGAGVTTTTEGVPPTILVLVNTTGWNGGPAGVVTTTC